MKNILKEEGLEPSPRRSAGTWEAYLKAHAETLWACDFFVKRGITARGIADLYVLVFMHLDSREVIVSTSTKHPDAEWIATQARAFVKETEKRTPKPTHLIRDRDTKFTAEFDEILRARDIKPKQLPIRSPNLNARVERFVQTIKVECLDRFIVFGQDHLDYLVSEFVEHYNEQRAHSGRDGHLPPRAKSPSDEWAVVKADDVVCKERLGGVIKTFERRAA